MCKVQEQPNISFVKLSSLASLLAMATDVMIYSKVGRQMGIKNSKCTVFPFSCKFLFLAAECVI